MNLSRPDKAGATLKFTESWEGYAEYAFRATGDVETSADLIPATLDIENEQGLISVGARYRFGN
jgi:opacity protein-like surface antigen